MTDVVVTELLDADRPYALSSWRESHKQAPGVDRVPWASYKREYGAIMTRLLFDGGALLLGAYRATPDGPSELLGFLVSSPGKRVDTLHWVQVKHKDAAGASLRRAGLMTKLIAAAEFGERFVYTMRARREPGHGTLDRLLAKKLAERGVVAGFVPLLEWVK